MGEEGETISASIARQTAAAGKAVVSIAQNPENAAQVGMDIAGKVVGKVAQKGQGM